MMRLGEINSQAKFLLILWYNFKLRREVSGDWTLDIICNERSIDTIFFPREG